MVTGVVEGFVAVAEGASSALLLSFSETKEDLVEVERVVLGEVTAEEKMGFVVVEAGGEEAVEIKDDGLTLVTAASRALLAFPHSASTSAMMSPPPEIESKVSREEMSASRELRLLSSGTSGGSEAGKGGTCSLVLLTLAVFISGVVVSDEGLAAPSCVVEPSVSKERGWHFGVSVRSSLMISTLLARDDMRIGLGGTSCLSFLSFKRVLTLPKRPFSPRRCRATGWDTVWTRLSPTPLLLPLNRERKLRDLAELTEEKEVRAGAAARMASSRSVSSSVSSVSP